MGKAPHPDSPAGTKMSKKDLAVGVLGLLIMLGTIGKLFGLGIPSVEVTDGIARFDTKLDFTFGHDPDRVANAVLSDLHAAVAAHPEVQGVEQTIYVNAQGLSDKYGNALKEDIRLGALTWGRAQVEEIAKYQAMAFVNNDAYKASVTARVAVMNHVRVR